MYNQFSYQNIGRSQLRGNPSNYSNPYAAHNVFPRQSVPATQQIVVNAIQGFLIQNQYEPDNGDPIVVEQAIFKGEVVKVGNKKKQVMNQSEALITSEGYASTDGKMWKHIPKIMMDVFKIGQLEINKITKLKARYQNTLPHHKVMKIQCGELPYYLAFKEKEFNEWFLRVVWARLIIDKRQTSQFGSWDRQVVGKIYKKSEILGDWQPRYVVIDQKSLRSSKENSNSVSLQIDGTKQIWTRFQELKGGYFLVVKLWYGIIKQEFAVPTAFCLKWLYHFLGLLVLK